MNGLNIDIRKEIIETEKTLKAINEKALETSKRQAINKVATKLKGQTAKETASAVKVKQKVIRRRIQIKKAGNQIVRGKKQVVNYATVKFKRRDIPLSSVGKPRQTKKGVRVGSTFYIGAFVADGSKGFGKYRPRHMRQRGMKHPYGPTKLRHLHVFRRLSKRRYSLEILGVSIKKAITQTAKQKTEALMRTDMPKELKSAMANQVRRLIKKDIKRGN